MLVGRDNCPDTNFTIFILFCFESNLYVMLSNETYFNIKYAEMTAFDMSNIDIVFSDIHVRHVTRPYFNYFTIF